MQCPNCHHLVDDPQAAFCPHCGLEFAQWNAQLLARLTPKKRTRLMLFMVGCLLLSLAGLGLVIIGPLPSIYIFVAVFCWYFLRYLGKQIGLIDRSNIPLELHSFLRWMGIGALLINISNIIIVIFAVIAFF